MKLSAPCATTATDDYRLEDLTTYLFQNGASGAAMSPAQGYTSYGQRHTIAASSIFIWPFRVPYRLLVRRIRLFIDLTTPDSQRIAVGIYSHSRGEPDSLVGQYYGQWDDNDTPSPSWVRLTGWEPYWEVNPVDGLAHLAIATEPGKTLSIYGNRYSTTKPGYNSRMMLNALTYTASSYTGGALPATLDTAGGLTATGVEPFAVINAWSWSAPS